MTPGYKQRREAKHTTQAANRPHSVNMDLETIDLTLRQPRLSWLNSKTHPQANGGRNTSGHAEEHALANADNSNPYQGTDGKWYFVEEGNHPCEVAYETRAASNIALLDYRKWLNTPKEIGGVPVEENS